MKHKNTELHPAITLCLADAENTPTVGSVKRQFRLMLRTMNTPELFTFYQSCVEGETGIVFTQDFS